MNYRSNLAFSLFVAVTVVVVVGVALLLDGHGGGVGDSNRRATFMPRPTLSCQFKWMGGPVRIFASAGDSGCAEARVAFETFGKVVRRDAADASEPTPVGKWTCQQYPLADYPLMARCEQDKLQFEVIGMAHVAHERPE
jgi:hypothetical protein